MVRKMNPSQEINTRSERFDRNLVWMKFELQLHKKKILNAPQDIFQPPFVPRKHDEVIGVTDVVFSLKFMLHKLVKLVHIDIDE